MQCFGPCLGGSLTPAQNCAYTLLPPSQLVGAAAASATIGVVTDYGCAWSATANAPHLTIRSGFSGLGPGAVSLGATANTSAAPRTGTLTIGERTATITQSGTSPLFIVTPNSLAFLYRDGAPPPADQALSLYTSSSNVAFAATSEAPWLTAIPDKGTAPGSLVVAVNPQGLAAGFYSGSITIAAAGATPASVAVPVSLTVESGGPPKLAVDSDALHYAFARGAQQARRERIPVANAGGGTLSVQASASTDSGGDWLSVTPDSGDATLSGPLPVTVNVDPGALGAGTYTGRISIRSGSERRDVPVTVTVTAVQQSILLSQTGLTFTAVAGGGLPPSQTIGILNAGQGFMDWTVSASTISGTATWLAVTPDSGLTDASSLNVPLVSVSVNPAGLDPGQYSGQVRVVASAADNTPQFVSVVLNVLPAGSDPGPVVLPTGLIFAQAAGGPAAAPQRVRISNLTAVQRTFTSGRLTTDGASWFTVTPATGSVTPAQPVDITVTVNSAGLTPGIRRGVLTLLFQDGSARTVNLLYVLLGSAGVNSAGKARAVAGCTPSALLPLVTSIGAQFTVPAGWPNALEVRVVDDCGDAHTSGSVSASFSNGDPPVPLVSLKDGRWTGTWQVRNTQAPQVTITINADNPDLNILGTATVTGGVQTRANPPVVAAGAVLNSASYAPAAPLAPGSLVTIYGSNLAYGQATSPGLPLEDQLAGAIVTIGGKTAPLISVSDTQINAILPYGLPVNTRSQLIVRRGDAYTSPEPVTLAAAQPAIFTKSMDGKGQAVAKKDDGSLPEPGTPAQAGDAITFTCTGLGEVTPQAIAGVPASTSSPARVTNAVVLSIGDQRATVSSAALAPAMVGVYTVSATIPQGVTPGDFVPVVLTVAGQSSPAVTIAVK